VLVGMAVGIVLGWAQPKLGADMKPLGDAFIALIRMLVGPIIFCTVVHGIAGMNDMRRVGRVAVKALLYFEGITTLALFFALAFVNLWQPGGGMNIDPASLDTGAIASYTARAHEQGVAAFLLHIIPRTFVSAFVDDSVLQALFVSLLFAFGLSLAGEKAKPVYAFVEALTAVFFKIVGLIMWVAPIGAFGAIAFTVGAFGAQTLISLGELIVEFFLVCGLFVAVVFGIVARFAGVSLTRLLAYLRDEILVVLGTTSTETVLPRLIEKLERLGCEESVVGLVVPTGYSFNLDGTCLYLATVTVFLAQATNTHLDFWHQLGLMAVLLLTSKGAAGVAGAAFVVLAATLSTVGTVPVASIALILGIHRILAEALTFVNLVGNALATVVVADWEKAVDREVLDAAVGFRLRGALPQAIGTREP
jgi:aerobic C4-dicarboxylate transport protein